MANERQLIRSLTEPTMPLDEMTSYDVEDGTSSQIGSPSSNVKYSKQYGGAFPMVQVNDFVFEGEQIDSMEIRSEGFRPSASVTINVTNKSFYSTSYPKDGDLLSIFVRSKDDVFVPIRNDYDITNVSIDSQTRSGDGTENGADQMTITGVLRIPGYNAEKCFAKKGTSFKALMQTAKDLRLGFATNEVDTSDTQTWICPFDSVEDFLYDTAISSWKDENSFFTWFIDIYYKLNFVNVNPLFSEEAQIDDALAEALMTQDFGTDSKLEKPAFKTILSNLNDISNTNFFIENYAMQNFSAAINNREGYKRFLQYYDGLIKDYESIFIDPITSPESEKDKVILKGRANENYYLEQVKHKWLGVLYGNNGENCHEKYLYAKIQNYQNNVHLDKIVLDLRLPRCNFNLRRYQVLPIIIVNKRDLVRKKLTENEDVNNEKAPSTQRGASPAAEDIESTPFSVDKFYSGYYAIRDIIYKFDRGRFTQELKLIRREWPTPEQIN